MIDRISIAILVSISAVTVAPAQTTRPAPTTRSSGIFNNLSQESREAMGLNKLTPQEQAALEKYLTPSISDELLAIARRRMRVLRYEPVSLQAPEYLKVNSAAVPGYYTIVQTNSGRWAVMQSTIVTPGMYWATITPVGVTSIIDEDGYEVRIIHSERADLWLNRNRP